MAKYHKTKKGGRKHRVKRRTLRRKTFRRVPRALRGGYTPVGPNGGNLGPVPDTYPKNDAWSLPDPMAAGGVPIGKEIY